MRWPEGVVSILKALDDSGCDAWAVGGCVRDMLLGRAPHDWDVCTSAAPEQMRLALKEFRLIETGLKHGTLTVICDIPVEVTTYRVDGPYSDHRHPDGVRFVRDLARDLSRRDFTINAMAIRPDKPLTDLFDGRGDLRRRLVRCVGEPQRRFEEDALRMLRALRFASQLDFSIEDNTAQALIEGWGALKLVSAERVLVEWTRLLAGRGAGRVLAEFRPQINAVAPMRDIDPYLVDLLPPDPVLRMALLLNDPAPLKRLRGDNASLRRLKRLIEKRDLPPPGTRPEALRLLRDAGAEGARDLIRLWRARSIPSESAETLIGTALREGDCYSLSGLAVRGGDIIGLGIEKQKIGAALNTLLEKVIDGELPNDREALMGWCAIHLA